jgi:hypothetical protein
MADYASHLLGAAVLFVSAARKAADFSLIALQLRSVF